MNFPPIEEAIKKLKRSKIKQMPQNNLRASTLGHACDRYHYYSIANYQDRVLHDEKLQSIFDEGYLHEGDTIRQLQDAGFEITETQRPFQLDNPLITMHIDGKIKWEGVKFPFDVKSISANLYPQMNSSEDFMFSKYHYHRNYVAQMQLYLLGTGEEYGLLILKNKGTGEIKGIPMMIDIAFCDNLIKRAERVYSALSSKTPPARTDIMELCLECPFAQVCLPDLKFGEGIRTLDNKTLEELLDRRETLYDGSKEFEEIDKQVKGIVTQSGPGETLIGKYLIKVVEIKTTKKVPITWNDEESKYLKTTILKVEK